MAAAGLACSFLSVPLHMPDNSNPNRARDPLANERTFLAWIRTCIAVISFGFLITRVPEHRGSW